MGQYTDPLIFQDHWADFNARREAFLSGLRLPVNNGFWLGVQASAIYTRNFRPFVYRQGTTYDYGYGI